MRSRVAIQALTCTWALLLFCGVASATDGVILIDQARALAGGVTPGDTPGFPVTISLPGSYRLSGNLTVPDENTTAIEVTAQNVSIDLNGFMISGPTHCSGSPLVCTPTGTGNGIHDIGDMPSSLGRLTTLTVKNGVIRGMGAAGISVLSNIRVNDVQIVENGSYGIYTLSGILTGNYIVANGSSGALLSGSATVTGNQMYYNGEHGLKVNDQPTASGGLISGNTFQGNGGFGIYLPSYVGYHANAFLDNNNNGEQVHGGVNLGNNLCKTSLCP